ncbi:MAG: DUF6439 family protein [Oscillatoria sp. PMC 1068.18]|nr:DUF6439 family protein [Oscillatoria sp. PMC 1076.18]MEC4989461.1 DUF6439 family protein [Oscillatoria sp. PMC 1068.18]
MSQPTQSQLSKTDPLNQFTTVELAQALAERNAIAPLDWHRLKANRQAQALQHVTAALVFLLKQQPSEALLHLRQATGWLDRSISAPPCPTHGTKKASN